MTSPSKWDTGRDAGHDQFQHDVYQCLLAMPESCRLSDKPDDNYESHGEPSQRSIEIESAFIKGTRVLGFADICEYCYWPGYGQNSRRTIFYEVKPKIESVGAIIRQLKATKVLAEDGDWRVGKQQRYVVVVPATDPKLALLMAMAGEFHVAVMHDGKLMRGEDFVAMKPDS